MAVCCDSTRTDTSTQQEQQQQLCQASTVDQHVIVMHVNPNNKNQKRQKVGGKRERKAPRHACVRNKECVDTPAQPCNTDRDNNNETPPSALPVRNSSRTRRRGKRNAKKKNRESTTVAGLAHTHTHTHTDTSTETHTHTSCGPTPRPAPPSCHSSYPSPPPSHHLRRECGK